MKSPQSEVSTSSRVHSENIQRELSQLIAHLKADIRRVDDQRFRGLLEKSAEVLKDLRTLFERFGPADQRGAKQNPARGAVDDSARSPAGPGKKSEKTKSAPLRKSGASAPDKSVGTKITSSDVRSDKGGRASKRNGAATQSPPTAATAKPELVVAAPKPQDPDEIAAKAQQQRREARAPKMPGGQAAPRPVPSQSGKPIWSKPHSS